MSTDVEHVHAFPAEPGEPVRVTGDCECGMSIATFLQLNGGGNRTVGMRLDATAETPDEPLDLAGQIVITLPKSRAGLPPHPAGITVTDVITGMPIITFTDLSVSFEYGADVLRSNAFIAEMTMLCDQDGKPLIAKSPRETLVERYGPDGKPLTGRFRFLVADFLVA